MPVSERDMMGGLAKGLRIVEAFTADYPRLSISEAAEIAGLDRATARRCLLTLAELGYAAYDGKFFTVTPRVLRLGTGCLATMPLPKIKSISTSGRSVGCPAAFRASTSCRPSIATLSHCSARLLPAPCGPTSTVRSPKVRSTCFMCAKLRTSSLRGLFDAGASSNAAGFMGCLT